jgi:hypothetical protein
MAVAIVKDQHGRAVCARARAHVVDRWDDGIVVRLDVTPELIGQLVRGKADHIIVSSVGPRSRRLRAVT